MSNMQAFQQHIAVRLVEIEDEMKGWGLPMSKLTLIARDPNNDKMIVVLTNEDEAGLAYAATLAVNQQAAR